MMGQLIVLAIVMWISQTILGLWQFKRFNRHLKKMRSEGRVAIGKAKGRFFAGAIALFVIDDETKIIRGEIMQGRTVFANFKPLNKFNGMKLTELDETNCRQLSRSVKAAVLGARKDYENYTAIKEENDETENSPTAQIAVKSA